MKTIQTVAEVVELMRAGAILEANHKKHSYLLRREGEPAIRVARETWGEIPACGFKLRPTHMTRDGWRWRYVLEEPVAAPA